MNLPKEDPRHGRESGYKAGCRCDLCAAHKRASNKRSAINRKIKRIRRDWDFGHPHGGRSSTDT